MVCMNKSTAAAREKWSRIIAEQRVSGLSVARFCEDRGIPASSFFPWKRKLADAVSTDADAMFVEAKIGAADRHGDHGVTIVLAGGRRIMIGPGFDRRLLLDVIEALESSTGAAS